MDYSTTVLSDDHLKYYYASAAERRQFYRDKAWEALGNACAHCGATKNLLIKPRKFGDPLLYEYGGNRRTLHRRIVAGGPVTRRVCLLCPNCRAAQRRGLISLEEQHGQA